MKHYQRNLDNMLLEDLEVVLNVAELLSTTTAARLHRDLLKEKTQTILRQLIDKDIPDDSVLEY